MSERHLEGQHVIVTGAGRGLGRAMAEACAASGAIVTAVARSAAQLDETVERITAAGGRAQYAVLDVTDREKLGAWVAETHESLPIHGVVHAAGVQARHDAVDFPLDEFERVLAVNLVAPFHLTRDIARLQQRNRIKGSHVFIGSLGSSIGLPRVAAYCASKAGTMGLVRTLAAEWASQGIRVNSINPGYFVTELTRDLVAHDEARLLSRIPMGRLGVPEDVGGAAVFLLSGQSAYITGQLINVDGGWLAS